MANTRMEYKTILELANKELGEQGIALELTHDEDGFYGIDIIRGKGTDKESRENYAENYFESELDGLVVEAWHVALNEPKKGKVSKRVCINETQYGFVDIMVNADATEDEILDAAREAYQDGRAFWNSSDYELGEIMDN